MPHEKNAIAYNKKAISILEKLIRGYEKANRIAGFKTLCGVDSAILDLYLHRVYVKIAWERDVSSYLLRLNENRRN
jgi:hypothetical protein